MKYSSEKDPLGKAIYDYQFYRTRNQNIDVYSSVSEKDVIPVDYLFRKFMKMPQIEQKALNLCKGKVLDVGAGSGCHSVYLQQKFFNVTSLDISDLACTVMKDQGLQRVVNEDFFQYRETTFDTLLLMMNGIGFVGTINGLIQFFLHCKHLLNKDGCILLDSSDLIYLFSDNEGNEMEMDWAVDYYGQVKYKMAYKNIESDEFNWLFIDTETLTKIADKNGFICEIVMKDDHFAYLAKLTLK